MNYRIFAKDMDIEKIESKFYTIRYRKLGTKSMTGLDRFWCVLYKNEEEIRKAIADRVTELKECSTKIIIEDATDYHNKVKLYEWEKELTHEEVETVMQMKEELARLRKERDAIEKRMKELRGKLGG